MNRTLSRVLDRLGNLFCLAPLLGLNALLIVLPPRMFRRNWGTLSDRALLLCFTAELGIGLLGAGCAFVLDEKAHLRTVPRRLLSILPAAGLGAAAGFLLAPHDIYAAAVLAALGFAAFFAGSRAWFFRYGESITVRRYLVNTGFCCGAPAILAIAHAASPSVRPFAAVELALSVILLLGLNQGNMDELMRRRRHRPEQLPRKIRSYNLRLILVLAALLTASLVLYRPIAAGLTAGGHALMQVLRALMQWLTRDRGETASAAPVGPEPPKEIENPMAGLGDAKASPFWNYLAYVLLAGLAILLIANGPKLFRAAVRLCRKLAAQISEWLHRAHTRAPQPGSEEYTDADETVAAAPDDAPEDDAAAENARAWKRSYRQYRAMAPSAERVRRGYRLALQWLALQQVPVRPSDTTLEIARTAADTIDFVPLDDATAEYNAIRYGGATVHLNDPDALDALLARMAQTKTAPRISRLTRAARESQ